MFHFDPTLNQLPADRETVAYLALSSNQPNVAVPGRQAQGAQAFVVALRTSSQTISVFVALWLINARELVVYAYEKRHLPVAALDGAVGEAWNFCESMGFILDEVPFERLGAEDQRQVLARLHYGETGVVEPLPVEPPAALLGIEPTVSPGPGSSNSLSPGELARLGRLLSSF